MEYIREVSDRGRWRRGAAIEHKRGWRPIGTSFCQKSEETRTSRGRIKTGRGLSGEHNRSLCYNTLAPATGRLEPALRGRLGRDGGERKSYKAKLLESEVKGRLNCLYDHVGARVATEDAEIRRASKRRKPTLERADEKKATGRLQPTAEKIPQREREGSTIRYST